MIDLPCHIHPKLDNGPQSREDLLAMTRMEAKDGITDLVATLHFDKVFCQQDLEVIRKAVRLLNQHMKEEGVALKIYSGMGRGPEQRPVDLGTRGEAAYCRRQRPLLQARNTVWSQISRHRANGFRFSTSPASPPSSPIRIA